MLLWEALNYSHVLEPCGPEHATGSDGVNWYRVRRWPFHPMEICLWDGITWRPVRTYARETDWVPGEYRP